jgi:hypothetical protein
MKRCLNDNGIAQYAEYLTSKEAKPNDSIIDHIADCEACKIEVIEVAELIIQGILD